MSTHWSSEELLAYNKIFDCSRRNLRFIMRFENAKKDLQTFALRHRRIQSWAQEVSRELGLQELLTSFASPLEAEYIAQKSQWSPDEGWKKESKFNGGWRLTWSKKDQQRWSSETVLERFCSHRFCSFSMDMEGGAFDQKAIFCQDGFFCWVRVHHNNLVFNIEDPACDSALAEQDPYKNVMKAFHEQKILVEACTATTAALKKEDRKPSLFRL